METGLFEIKPITYRIIVRAANCSPILETLLIPCFDELSLILK
jgi:hypothetical protein